MEAQPPGCGGRGRRLHGPGHAQEEGRQEQPRGRVGDDQDPVAGRRGNTGALQHLGRPAPGQGAAGGGEGASQVIPGEDAGAAVLGQHLGEGRLLDGQEGAHLVARGADHPEGGCQHQHREVPAEDEGQAGRDHEARPQEEHPLAPEAVRVERDGQRDQSVAHQRQGQQQPDAPLAEAEGREVEHQHHGEEAVGEHPRRPGHEEQAAIGAEGPEVGQERRHGCNSTQAARPKRSGGASAISGCSRTTMVMSRARMPPG